RDGADKLRDKLDKIADRYEKVAVKVTAWAEAVEDAQDATSAAHRSATAADDIITHLEKVKEADLTATQKGDLDEARAALVRAQAKFDGAVEDYHRDANRLAGQIEDLLDDTIEDSWWSWTANVLERNADLINEALEIVGWIA